jgi:DNA polymerase-3 subunit epsilon
MSENNSLFSSQQLGLSFNQTDKLSPGFPEKLVILDCETTGGKPTYHRIIEIGLLIIENGKIIETWESFIKPNQHLPQNIQSLTGISPDMLVNAPEFHEIADLLLEKLNGRTLTAHNARFDYGFLKNEFARVGSNYTTKPLCSVKLSRTLYPQFKRHGLDQIIKRFKLNIHSRHRAFDDARAIYDFFLHSSHIFTEDDINAVCQDITHRASLPYKLNSKVIDTLPKQPGVYYFHDEKGQVLYIGKSVNIRNRVLSHFSQDYKNHKDLKMSSRIADVSFETTASDFSAQLLESQEIKKQLPIFNHRLRKVKKLYQLEIKINSSGYAIPTIKEQGLSSDLTDTFGLFRSYRQLESKLKELADKHNLCFKLLGLEGKNTHDSKPCFRYQLKKCHGACCHKESAELYNSRLNNALENYQRVVWPWQNAIVLEEKNSDGDSYFHLIKDWVYLRPLSSPDEIYDLGYQTTDTNTDVSNPIIKKPDFNESDGFDLDTYFILIRFLLNTELMSLNRLSVHPLCQNKLGV